MVQAQLVENAVEGFGVQVQDGDQGGERRRSGGSGPAGTARRKAKAITSREEEEEEDGLSRLSNPHPSSSSSLSLPGTKATMMEQSLAVLVMRY